MQFTHVMKCYITAYRIPIRLMSEIILQSYMDLSLGVKRPTKLSRDVKMSYLALKGLILDRNRRYDLTQEPEEGAMPSEH
jgi:hypothetical protein